MKAFYLFVVFSLSLILFLDACSFSGQCESDSDCDGDRVCHKLSGRCLTFVANTPLPIEVVPPQNESGLIPEEFSNTHNTLALTSALSLQGQVLTSDVNKSIPARIRLWRASNISGRPPVYVETTIESEQSFLLWLKPHSPYSLFVSPSEPYKNTYPPKLDRDLEINDHLIRDLVLDGQDRSILVTGKVLGAGSIPLNYGVTVNASHVDGWLRSTDATTCSIHSIESCTCNDSSCQGEFSFRVPYGVRSYTLKIQSSEEASTNENEKTNLIPKMECEGIVLGIVSPETPQAKTTIKEALILPEFAPPQSFTFKIVNENDEPISGVVIRAQRDFEVKSFPAVFEKCSASFSQQNTTNSSGELTLWLPPSSEEAFTLSILSPPASQYASTRLKGFVLNDPSTPIVLHLEPRFALSGRLLDEQGDPLIRTQIIAKPSQQAPSDVYAGASSTITDERGNFTLYTDLGSFNLHFTPSTFLPSFSALGIQANGNVDGLEYQAPPSGLVRGQIETEITKYLADFSVNAYLPQDSDINLGSAILRGTARTSKDGKFELILPIAP